MELEDADGIEKQQFSYVQQLSELISWTAFSHLRKAWLRVLCNSFAISNVQSPKWFPFLKQTQGYLHLVK